MVKTDFSLKKDKEDSESIRLRIETESPELYLLPGKTINQVYAAPLWSCISLLRVSWQDAPHWMSWNNRNSSSPCSGGWKFKIRMQASHTCSRPCKEDITLLFGLLMGLLDADNSQHRVAPLPFLPLVSGCLPVCHSIHRFSFLIRHQSYYQCPP